MSDEKIIEKCCRSHTALLSAVLLKGNADGGVWLNEVDKMSKGFANSFIRFHNDKIKKAREEVIKELQTLCHIKEGDVWKKLTISKLAWERLIEKLNSSQARNTPQSESGSKKEVEE